MLRSLLRASAALACAALLSPAVPAAAPPPGLAYDEIVRVLVSQTPPPPGNFTADLAAARSATPVPLAAATTPPRRGGLGAIAGAIISGNPNAIAGNVAGAAVADALGSAIERSVGGQFAAFGDAMRGFLQPHAMHYAYWNGWERIDDPAAQTATIRKCDMGQVIRLDLARRTYAVYTPQSEPSPTAAPVARRPRAQTAAPAQPGTGTASLTNVTRPLGNQRIETVATSGYETTTTFAMTNATGSCSNGSASIRIVQYLPSIARPSVNSCPLHVSLPEAPEEIVAPPSGGCRPTFQISASGPQLPTSRLSLYTLVRLNRATANASPAPEQPGGFGFLTERGNLRALGPADASLFAIPPGFTKS